MLPARCPACVEQTLLRHEDERLLGNFSSCHIALSNSNFIYGAAEMNCARAAAGVRFPWNRVTHCVIDFENPRSMLKGLQSASVRAWQLLASDAQKSPY